MCKALSRVYDICRVFRDGILVAVTNIAHMTQVRHPQDTFSSTVRIVLPNDTNTLGNLMGGNLLHWMDIAAAVSANRHCRRVVVTAAVNNVSFDRPIRLGEVVIIESQVTRSFNSSMEVFLEVFVENATTGERSRCNEAYYTCLLYTSPSPRD